MRKTTPQKHARPIAFALVTFLAASTVAGISASPAMSAPTAVEISATDDLVEQALTFAKRKSKPLPVYVVDTILLMANTWKQFKNGEKVDEAVEKVTAVMKIVAEIKADVDVGREMTDREFRRTFELLDMHARGLKDLDARVGKIEDGQVKLKVKTDKLEQAFGRPGCGVGAKRRNGRGPCVPAADYPL